MYAINANRVRWTEFLNWLAQRGLVEGQDYTFAESVPGWTVINFNSEADFTDFCIYGGTLTYD